MNIPENLAQTTDEALLSICLFAAFCDGAQSDSERNEISRLCEEMGLGDPGLISRRILTGRLELPAVVAALANPNERLLAYEMALGVCESDGSLTDGEKKFLQELQGQLGLNSGEAPKETAGLPDYQIVPVAPAAPAPSAVDNSGTILKFAILNGALELLPDTLATMAIIPLQMKMVHGIGRSHGVELDRSSIKEFLAVAGVGLGSQVVEGFARKLMRGIGKKVAGKLAGKAVDQITGSAFSFASTYALGQLAEKYYQGGRRLDTASSRQLFTSLQSQARDLHTRYLPQIQEKAKSINPASILQMVTGSNPV
jgi:uncharacterized protein (DUF697 family)/tellurite resistance protein